MSGVSRRMKEGGWWGPIRSGKYSGERLGNLSRRIK